MLQTKKIKRKTRRKRILQILFFSGYILFFLILIIFVWASKFFPNDFVISPIAKSSQKSLTSILEKKNIKYDSVEKIEDYYLVKVKGAGDVLISTQKDLDEQVSSLQLISSRLKIEGKTFRRLDFRYEKTVVAF